MEILNLNTFSQLVTLGKPYAAAVIKGNNANPQITGTVRFYPAAHGTMVAAEVFGLPSHVMEKGEVKPAGPFYAFHLHTGAECGSGAEDDPFASSGAHYNPTNQPHPMHAGDMPPLLGNDGYAYLSFFTGRFSPEEIVGKVVVVHGHSDDLKTQPSGGAGLKLACGKIMKTM